ncbi:MAG: ribonuclease H [Pseudomonadota bacterium]
MAASSFTCSLCGARFSIPPATLARFPGWTPRTCMACRDKVSPGAGSSRSHGGAKATPRRAAARPRPSATIEENLPLAEVLSRYQGGPLSGVFTDGSAQPNPGPGGWGTVFVVDNQVVAQEYGHDPHTTNNRMELLALIHGYRLVPAGTAATVYTDSELCVKSMNEWAEAWARRGWKRKGGPIKNLELVQELYSLVKARPELRLTWIKAHDGSRWNEYADALSTAWARDVL